MSCCILITVLEGKRRVITQRTFLYKIQICPSWKLLHEDPQSPDSHKQCLHTLTLLLVTLGRRVPLIAEGHMDQRVPTVQFGNHGCNVPLFVSCYMSLWFTGESQIRNRLPDQTYCEWRPRVFGHPQITLPLSSHSDLDFFSPDYFYVHHCVGGAVHICASNKVSEHKVNTMENISLNCISLLCRWRSDLFSIKPLPEFVKVWLVLLFHLILMTRKLL